MNHNISSLFILSLFFAASVASLAKTVEIKPSKRLVEEQQADNKRWEKEARDKESELFNKGQTYYEEKAYQKAAEYFQQVLDLRYPQWDLKEVGEGRFRTIQPAQEKVWRALDTSLTRRARARLERDIPQKVAAEREQDIKSKIDAFFEKADVATMLGDRVKAYGIYQDLIAFTKSVGDSKLSVSSRVKAQDKCKEILTQVVKPLDEAESLIKAGKVEDANKILQRFPGEAGAFMDLVPEIKQRYEGILKAPEMVALTREAEVQQRILAGDTALLREDYVGAEQHYRAAATLYPDVKSSQVAAQKLAQMLADPKIVAALKAQQIERECKPLVARARYLVRMMDYDAARATCQEIIERYPDTEWAAQAKEILGQIE